jgi:hypothetical protein
MQFAQAAQRFGGREADLVRVGHLPLKAGCIGRIRFYF